MSRFSCALAVCAGVCLWALPSPSRAAPVPEAKKPQIEVVFCLDTTGSMGGLIDGAKQKIWAICNQIAGGKPTPDLKVGLVAYRDRGDDYVTKVFDLSADLDAIHAEIKKFTANGGGDAPESVNQALDDAVNKVKWSTDKKTLRIIFLVGDAPPHMDYPDDVKYPVSCKKAVEKGIIINTVQCGTDPECTKYWKDIAAKAEGSFVAIPQSGGVVAIATPYDARLAELNTELTKTAVVYGKRSERERLMLGLEEAKKLDKEDAAERAGFVGKTGAPAPAAARPKAPGEAKGGDLVLDVKEGRAKLSELKDDELPEEFKKLKTEKERKEYIEKMSKKREELNKEVVELDRKRSEYIKKELAKKGKDKDSFDASVLELLRKQAKKADVEY